MYDSPSSALGSGRWGRSVVLFIMYLEAHAAATDLFRPRESGFSSWRSLVEGWIFSERYVFSGNSFSTTRRNFQRWKWRLKHCFTVAVGRLYIARNPAFRVGLYIPVRCECSREDLEHAVAREFHPIDYCVRAEPTTMVGRVLRHVMWVDWPLRHA